VNAEKSNLGAVLGLGFIQLGRSWCLYRAGEDWRRNRFRREFCFMLTLRGLLNNQWGCHKEVVGWISLGSRAKVRGEPDKI
jgi:hypothetical protein